MTDDLMTRLWSRVDVAGPNDCWPWAGSRSGGRYGYISHDGRKVGTHRVAWEAANGSIPSGLIVCHTCDNPPCCNPRHLFLGTHKDNADDRTAKGRGGHALGLHSSNGRLTPGEVDEIRRRYIPGMHPRLRTGGSPSELAAEFRIHPSYVREIGLGLWRKSA